MKRKISGISTRIRSITRRNKLLLAFAAVIIAIVALRIPAITQGMVNTEWNNATTLRHFEIWDQTSPLEYSFNPITTYQTPANGYIDNHASTQEGFSAYLGTDDNYYYTTYPQFGFIAPYVVFKVLGVEPGLIPLRIFSIFVHVLTALLVYAIARLISNERKIGFLAFASYMLQPIALHYYPNNYMSDMLLPLFFVSTVYLFLRIILGKSSRTIAALFILSMFLMIYTEYMGLFVAGMMLLYALFNQKKDFARLVIWSSVLVPPAAVFLMAFQYASVGDMQSFLSVMIDRYTNGYGPYDTEPAVREILNKYSRWFAPSLVAILAFVGIRWFSGFSSRQDKQVFSEREKRGMIALVFVAAIPVLIHHGVMLRWTAFHAQYFSLLKAAPVLSIAVALSAWYLLFRTRLHNKTGLSTVVCAFLIFSIFWSWSIYQKSLFPDRLPFAYCESGRQMGEFAGVNEVIFVKDSNQDKHSFPISPVFVYCAKRNIELYSTEEQARELMHKNNAQSGVIFTLTYFRDEGVHVTNIEKIEASN